VSLVRRRPVWMTNHPPSVLWYCWLGHQTCKNRRPYNQYCVGADVKPCSINQSINSTDLSFLRPKDVSRVLAPSQTKDSFRVGRKTWWKTAWRQDVQGDHLALPLSVNSTPRHDYDPAGKAAEWWNTVTLWQFIKAVIFTVESCILDLSVKNIPSL